MLTPSAITVYSYDGRKVSQPRFHGLRTESLSASSLSLAADCVAVIDPSDRKQVRCCDVLTGKPMGNPIAHKAEVVYVALNQTPVTSGSVERQLIVIDRNAELFLYLVSNFFGQELQAPHAGRHGGLERDVGVALPSPTAACWCGATRPSRSRTATCCRGR